MALRVLLADESATIKRVIQLALQDFGVEVKSVPVGSDVLTVARSFQPDVVFADVLLSKRSGYEVCSDLKNDSELQNIPVVLMWSGFMELDQAKVVSSRVDRQIEKPFDPDQLRNLIKDLVPHLQGNLISSYLSFPNRPEFVGENASAAGSTSTSADSPVGVEEFEEFQSETFSADGDEEAEEFRHVPLPRARSNTNLTSRDLSPRDHEDWSQEDLAQFRVSAGQMDEISLPEIDDNVSESPVWSTSGEEMAIDHMNLERDLGPSRKPKSNLQEMPEVKEPVDLNLPNLDFERAEQILREQAREVLQNVAWRLLPDIAERVIREELQKLLKDSERLDEI